MTRPKYDLAQRIANLDSAKRLPLLQKMLDQGLDISALPIVPYTQTQTIPLSQAQQGLWLTWRLDPDGSAYNMWGGFQLTGKLDYDAFSAAVDALAERHSILRTLFQVSNDDNSAVQILLPELNGHLDYKDITALVTSEHIVDGAYVEESITAHATKGFDLEREPAWRILLIKEREDSYKLSIVAHHIIADGHSVTLLMRDLASLYEAITTQQSPNLPELPIQYADYSLWQQDRFSLGELSNQLDYWKEHLTDVPKEMSLPLDRQRPATRTGEGAVHKFSLDGNLARQLRRNGEQNNAIPFVTPFMVVMALLNIVLARYSGQKDISVGTPIANRKQAETENLIGYFLNLLVLRSEVDINKSFAELLAAVRDELLAAHDHSDCPFDAIVSQLSDKRVANIHPLFQVKCAEQTPMERFPSFGELSVSVFGCDVSKVHFDLSLDFYVTEEAIECQFTYATDILDRSTVQRMADYFVALATNVSAANVSGKVTLPLVDLLPETDLSIAIGEKSNEQKATNILQNWQQSVTQFAERVAVRSEKYAISYGDLDAQSNDLAHHLIALGVQPESRVAVYAERSCEFVLYTLAVLKAGGTYVPLDPALPYERLDFQIKDSRAVLLLGQREPEWNGQKWDMPIPTVIAGFDDIPNTEPQKDAPDIAIHTQQAAYIIYTSGSTGEPKGVLVSHRSLVNYVGAINERLRLPETVVNMAMVSTVSADLGHTVLFGAICHGRTLHLMASDCIADPDMFANYMQDHHIDALKITPGHLKGLLNAQTPADVLPSSHLILGGEACLWSLVDEIKAFKPALNIVNHYGPTETTVGVLSQFANDATQQTQSLPLGYPLVNCDVYILDSDLYPVPKGSTGELYVGGTQLAHGYQNRFAQTSERFIANPFHKGERLYRTGDQVKMLHDGSIVFQGRVDNQVKIRGYRVEPEEISRVLQEVSGVAQAHVVVVESTVQENADGGNKLYGYVVLSKAQHSISAESLREALSSRLPDYMIPDAIMLLEAFPLTPNGKINQAMLPSPNNQLDRCFDAPQGEIESSLAEVWSEVLGIEQVGRGDSFFSLGGDSILSLKVVARARKRGIQLTPKQLLDNKSLKEIAQLMAQSTKAEPEQTIPVLSESERKQAIAPSYAQTRQWFLWQLEPNSTAYHISGALRLTGDLDITELRDSFAALVARHESLRTVFRSDADGQVKQVIQAHYQQNENELGFRFVDLVNRNVVDGNLVDGDLDERDQSECRLAVQREAAEIQQQPFDLENGPLLRVGLIKQAEKDYVLVVVMHHIISDGWSMQIIVNEFVDQYRARVSGSAPAMATLPIQYADYAVWQRQWLEAGEKARQLRYWTQQLGSEHPVLALPTDFPRKVEAHYGAAHYELALPDALIDSLRRCARDQDATLFMVLLAGFQVLLQRYTGQEDIRVGVPIANRQRTETENVVGFFVNTQVLRSGLDGRTPLNDVLMRVREAALSAQDHQDLPFEQLVDALQPERNMGINPLFQVMYNHQRKDHQALASLPNVTLDNYPLGEQSAQFDLTLDSMETPDGRVKLTFTYAKELFRAQTIERMAGHYQTVLEALVQQVNQRVSDIELLSDSEHQQLIHWGVNPERYYNVRPVHQLIEQQVNKYPDATALIFNDQQLSYGELNTRANQLAHYLIAQGVRPESKVGIAVEHSIDMVIGLLGILKAGGAYVPLDPEYPSERLAYMVQDSGIELLLTQSHLVEQLPIQGCSQVIVLDQMDFSDHAQHSPGIVVHAENLAYVIYTSGSTGKPKGVNVAHTALSMHIQAASVRYGITRKDRLMQFASIGFDAAAEQWILPLAVGGCVVLPAERHLTFDKLVELVTLNAVTVLYMPPAYWQQLTENMPFPLDVRVCITGGEALPRDVFNRICEFFNPEHVFNAYGPTETVISPTICLLKPADHLAEGSISIGHPVGERQAFVLDVNLNLVPQGGVGELFLGGIGLAREYLRRPSLSAERFIANPFGNQGERLYRTGDLVRWNTQGQLDYLGRIDQQVKVRGFRIELGEIEEQLLLQPYVKEAIVMVFDTDQGGRIVGYVTQSKEERVDSLILREKLSQSLPNYMVPSAIVIMEKLPLNVNGKIDRRKLPTPDFATELGYEAPQGEQEKALSEVWSEVLGVERVGRYDNFFELGGDSILALKLYAKMKQLKGLDQTFSLQTIMSCQSIYNLMCHSGVQNKDSNKVSNIEVLTRISSSKDSIPLFCIPPGVRNSADYLPLANALKQERSVLGVMAPSGLERETDLERIASAYADSICDSGIKAPYAIIGWSMGATIAIHIANALEDRGEAVAYLGLVDCFVPSDANTHTVANIDDELYALLANFMDSTHIEKVFSDLMSSKNDSQHRLEEVLNISVPNIDRDTSAFIINKVTSYKAWNKAISQETAFPKLKTKVDLYWAKTKSQADIIALNGNTGFTPSRISYFETDHQGIIKDRQFIRAVSSAMAEVDAIETKCELV